MDLLDSAWAAAVCCALVAAAGGLAVPRLIAALPEPPEPPESPESPVPVADSESGTPEPDLEEVEVVAPAEPTPRPLFGRLEASPEKIPYVDLAAERGLAPLAAAVGALVAGAMALALGWSWPLTYLTLLVPVGFALAYVDLRVWLLPTRLIWPTLGLVAALVLIGWPITGDGTAVVRALVGAAAYWLYLAVFWWLGGMGFGDVRLAALLGFALGSLGWSELVVGAFAGFLLGAVGWIPLRLLRISRRRNLPFGPFLLLGAVVGVLWGGALWSAYR